MSAWSAMSQVTWPACLVPHVLFNVCVLPGSLGSFQAGTANISCLNWYLFYRLLGILQYGAYTVYCILTIYQGSTRRNRRYAPSTRREQNICSIYKEEQKICTIYQERTEYMYHLPGENKRYAPSTRREQKICTIYQERTEDMQHLPGENRRYVPSTRREQTICNIYQESTRRGTEDM